MTLNLKAKLLQCGPPSHILRELYSQERRYRGQSRSRASSRVEEGKKEYMRGDKAYEILLCCNVGREAGGKQTHRPTLPSCGTARELHIPNTDWGRTHARTQTHAHKDKGACTQALRYRGLSPKRTQMRFAHASTHTSTHEH